MSSDLEARFKKAVWLIRNGPAEKSSNETKLLFYSYFKQVRGEGGGAGREKRRCAPRRECGGSFSAFAPFLLPRAPRVGACAVRSARAERKQGGREAGG